MPFIHADQIVTASYAEEIVTIALDWSIIKNVTLSEPSRSSDLPECYGVVGIMQGGVTFAHIIASLASGYLGNCSTLHWNGKILTEAGCHIFASFYAHTGQTYRLSVTYEDIPNV